MEILAKHSERKCWSLFAFGTALTLLAITSEEFFGLKGAARPLVSLGVLTGFVIAATAPFFLAGQPLWKRIGLAFAAISAFVLVMLLYAFISILQVGLPVE